MEFTKMHGCGNDYIYVDCTKTELKNESELAIKLSDRHFGIGGDGLILIKKGTIADFEMVMYNADGSRGAMCGNGMRCVSKYIYDNHLCDKTEFTVESMGAIKYITCKLQDGKVSEVTVDMGKPEIACSKIPVKIPTETAIGAEITVQDKTYKMTCVSMGNPHAVIFIDTKPSEFPVCELGPFFENHPLFPNRTNTEFVFVEDEKNLHMRVWERGSGETLACGTGACATVVASILNKHAKPDTDITVHLVGGDLKIKWDGNLEHSVIMTGPATTVFTGSVDID